MKWGLLILLFAFVHETQGQVPQGEVRQFNGKYKRMPLRDSITIDELVAQTIPIYTIKNPNPKSGRPDCRITTRDKEGFRLVMKQKMIAAQTDQERQSIIEHYKRLFS